MGTIMSASFPVNSENRGGPAGKAGPARQARFFQRFGRVAALSLLAVAGIVLGCSEENTSRPEDTPTNVITAYYQSREEFERGVIELNGERIDLEWGSEFTPERPYTQVRLSAEQGSGSPGATKYVSVKAIYTDTHLYLLMQWTDPLADAWKDVFTFAGPNFGDPIIRCVDGVCDTTDRVAPQDSLLLPAWWRQSGEDDKLALIFEMEGAIGDGETFADRGCKILCHPSGAMSFGNFDSGRLDVWEWLAGRTNPIRDIFNPNDDPDDPSQGTPGYMDDLHLNPMAGLAPDPGLPGFMKNFEDGAGVPLRPYRRINDPLDDPQNPDICRNLFNANCVSNNGVPSAYLWREQATQFFPFFSAGDVRFEGNFPADPRPWMPGDPVPGYVLTYPSGSREDVRAKGGHDEEMGVWTLEVARRLDTGDPQRDVTFLPESGRDYVFTIAVFDADIRDHWGSEPQILRFGPKESR